MSRVLFLVFFSSLIPENAAFCCCRHEWCGCVNVCVGCRRKYSMVLVACRFFFYIWRQQTMNGRCKGQVHIHEIACVQADDLRARHNHFVAPIQSQEWHLFFAMTVQVDDSVVLLKDRHVICVLYIYALCIVNSVHVSVWFHTHTIPLSYAMCSNFIRKLC